MSIEKVQKKREKLTQTYKDKKEEGSYIKRYLPGTTHFKRDVCFE